jgi:hypothetical protein
MLGETVEIVGGAEVEMFIDIPPDAVAALESFTCALNEKEPARDGVPEIVPVDELRDKPLGSRPLVVLHV